MNCPNCHFDSPPGFDFCGRCGARLQAADERLSSAEIDHARAYLAPELIEELSYNAIAPGLDLLARCAAPLSGLIDVVAAHLPPYLAAAVLRDPVPGRPGGQFFDGTAMFADISGFTAMSEKLSRSGREGAEEIGGLINRYCTVMLAILREHGGQLINFGGDALLGLFQEPHSATRAAQSAWAMQQAMAQFALTRTSAGEFPLQMKVALKRGRFFAAQLGDASGMKYGLFGADVNATASAESAARAGQVIFDRVTAEALTIDHRLSPLADHDRYFLLERVAPADSLRTTLERFTRPIDSPTLTDLRLLIRQLDALAAYLPTGLPRRLATEARRVTNLEGEHRLVTVLFANVHGWGEIADRLGANRETEIVAALNRIYLSIQNAAQQFGGVVNKIDLYDHGDKILALFGAPIAHEDDVERAVRTALALQRALNSANPIDNRRASAQIGLSYGYVYAGYVGAAWRQEYTVMGDTVNLAARLMTVCEPGGVIVNDAVRRRAQALFELAARGEVRVKGKSQPISIFAVQGLRAVPEPLRGLEGMQAPLVGRASEWSRLLAAFDQLRLGRGQIVSISGEAGLGKSRLVGELRQSASDVAWLSGHCLSFTEAASYALFQQIVRQLIELAADETGYTAARRLREQVGELLPPDHAEASLPYLLTFLNLPLDDELAEAVRFLDAEALQRRTFVAVRSLMLARYRAARRPLSVLLEDVHWIDQASAALLDFLLPLVDQLPIVFLLVFRPERDKTCWRLHERAAREFVHCSTTIALEPLTGEAGAQLLHELVPLVEWPDDLRDMILQRTDGNPLYVEEVLRTLIDNHTLEPAGDGQWRLARAVGALMVPDTLQGVMMTRLDRLDEDSRRAAQIAAVVGRSFSYDIIARLVDDSAARLHRQLATLQQHEVVREAARVPQLSYAFLQNLMQEVCYATLLARLRRAYHLKIVDYLETTAPRDGSSTAHVALAAYHAFAGQDWPRALHYQVQAGEQARRLFANHEAIDHFEKALQCATQLAEEDTRRPRQEIQAALGELLTVTSQYERAEPQLVHSEDLAHELSDAEAQARACRWLAHLHELRGDYGLAFDAIQRGLNVVDQYPCTEAAELHLIAGIIHTRQGEASAALRECGIALAIAQQLNAIAVLARAYNLLGVIRLRDHSVLALADFQTALAWYEQIGDLHGQAKSHNLVANAASNLGQWHDADRHYRQARELFDQIGDVYYTAVTDNNLGDIAISQDRLDDAVQFFQRALQALERSGSSPYILGILHMNLGHTHVRRGEIDLAWPSLRSSRELFERAQARDFLPELERHCAEAALARNQWIEADQHIQHSLALADELGMRAERGQSRRVQGEWYLKQQQLSEAETILRQSLNDLEAVGNRYELARAQLLLAQVQMINGQITEAQSALQTCLIVFEALSAQREIDAARRLLL
jgi:class 3 adenylate cyclase/predicted ATPase